MSRIFSQFSKLNLHLHFCVYNPVWNNLFCNLYDSFSYEHTQTHTNGYKKYVLVKGLFCHVQLKDLYVELGLNSSISFKRKIELNQMSDKKMVHSNVCYFFHFNLLDRWKLTEQTRQRFYTSCWLKCILAFTTVELIVIHAAIIIRHACHDHFCPLIVLTKTQWNLTK